MWTACSSPDERRDVMPLTFGTLRPTIVLPASADEWPGNAGTRSCSTNWRT